MYPIESCIGIAVDHRLQRLVGRLPSGRGLPPGRHGQLLEELAASITRPEEVISPEEIDFTVWLSQPATISGIVAMLQQPANEHPYDQGREITFNGCDTLVSLDECFKFASSGTFGLDQITVLDDLPYTRKKDETDAEYRSTVRRCVLDMIDAKRPSVVLCMSQEREHTPSATAMFKSLGVGKTFGDSNIRFGRNGQTKRINAFHPSFALYHRSYESAFRQLLLLEVTRACGELRGDWKEEPWMRHLRLDCRKKARMSKSAVQYALFHHVEYQHGANRTQRGCLESNLKAIEALLTELGSLKTNSTRAISQLLIDRRAAERCNDASLCLRDIDAKYQNSRPFDQDDDSNTLNTSTVAACKKFLVNILRSTMGPLPWLQSRKFEATGFYTKSTVSSAARASFTALAERKQLQNDILEFLQQLNGSFILQRTPTRMYQLAITDLSGHFLSLAIAFEAELGRLVGAQPDAQTTAPAAEQELSLNFSHLSIH